MMNEEEKDLAMAASVGLLGLALKALLADGQAPALAALDQVESGAGSLVFCVRIVGETTEILGSLDVGKKAPTFLVDLKLVGVRGVPAEMRSPLH